MELLRWKARLSVLWVFMAVGMLAAMLLLFMMPDEIKEMMAGEFLGMQLTEGVMVIIMLFWLIPLVMAALCLTLNDSPVRWLNFVLGILFGLCFIAGIVDCLVEGESLSVALWVMMIAGLLVAFFITWYAWKLPKLEA